MPGMTAFGFLIYSRNVSSSQTIPEFLFAGEYLYPSTEPECRPIRPLSSGPTPFLAYSPIWWQARHAANTFLPASASSAEAVAVAKNTVATDIMAA